MYSQLTNQDLELFEQYFSLIDEVSRSYSPASGAIAAGSEAPRKDFGPMGGNGYPPSSTSKGLLDPYQQHPSAIMPDPDRPPSIPFPLSNVEELLGTSFVYLDAAIKQIKLAIKLNKALDPVYKTALIERHKKAKHALKLIKAVGKDIINISNLNY